MKKRFGLVQFETPEGVKYQGIIEQYLDLDYYFHYLDENGCIICNEISDLQDYGWKMTHDLRSEYWIGQEGYFSDIKNSDSGVLQGVGGYSVHGYHALGVSWKYFTPFDREKVAIKCEIEQLKKQIRDLEAKL